MSRMPANMSLKAFAPRIASPDTTPLVSSVCPAWGVVVVVHRTAYLPSDHVPDRCGSYLATLNGIAAERRPGAGQAGPTLAGSGRPRCSASHGPVTLPG